MRKILLSVFVGFLVIGGLVYVFVPLSSAAEICSAIEPWGVGDTNTAQLNRPMGLAWTDGFLYLADTENGEIKKFAEDGSLVARWPGFKRLVAVAVMGDTVYVADFLTDRITKLRVYGTVIAW